MKDIIFQKLNNYFSPKRLEVINESHKHASHKQSPRNGNSHFVVKIKSDKLSNLSRLEGQRQIYKILENELKKEVHSLSIKIIY